MPKTDLEKELSAQLIALDMDMETWEAKFINSRNADQAEGFLTDLQVFWGDNTQAIVLSALFLGVNYPNSPAFTDNRVANFAQLIQAQSLEAVRQPNLITNQMRNKLDKAVINKFGRSQWERSAEIKKILDEEVNRFRLLRREPGTPFVRETRFTPRTYSQLYARTRAAQAHTEATQQAAILDGMGGYAINITPPYPEKPALDRQFEGRTISMAYWLANHESHPPYHPNCLHIATPVNREAYDFDV